MSDTFWFYLNWIILQVNLLIFFCYWIYCCLVLHKHIDAAYFVKRRPIFTIIFLCNVLLWLIKTNIGAIFLVLDVANLIQVLFHIAIALIVLGFGATAYLCRLWLLYFDMQLSRSLQNKSWQMAIDPNIESKNWFLNPKNQRKYGRNGKILLLYGFSCDIFVFIIFYIVRVFIENMNAQENLIYSQNILVVYYMIKIGCGIKLWRKFRIFKTYDNFGIYYELKKTIQISLVYCLLPPIIIPISRLVISGPSSSIFGTASMIYGIVILHYLIPNVINYNESRSQMNNNTTSQKMHELSLHVNDHHRNQLQENKMSGTTANTDVQVITPKLSTTAQSFPSRGKLCVCNNNIDTAHDKPNSSTKAGTSNDTGDPTILTGIQIMTPGKKKNINVDQQSLHVQNIWQHWTTAVVAPFIYEKFMNHLQGEFSLENLLFITEYVQIKNILKKQHHQLRKMMLENVSIKFDVKLGQLLNDDILKDENKAEERMNRSGSIINETPPIVPVSLIAKRLSENGDIILAFKSIYHKYIDADYAPFMINISCHCREILKNSLDCNYYKQLQKGSGGKPKSSFSGDKMFGMYLSNFMRGNGSSVNNHDVENKQDEKPNKENKIADDTSLNEAFIDCAWIENERSIEWLLIRLLAEMDRAALEVSALMNLSFLRFRKQSNVQCT